MKQDVSSMFREQTWSKVLPKQMIIPSATFELNSKDIEFLTDDDTNPDPHDFSICNQIVTKISQFGGSVFAKFANRSPKDCTHLDRKIKSVQDLILLVKMSQFLTEALCQDEEGAELVLRKYEDLLEKQMEEFRIYVLEGKIVGICQKNPSFLSSTPTINQVQQIEKIKELLLQFFQKEEKQAIDLQFVFDVYVAPNGSRKFILAIEPFHIHPLSLFTEEELRNRIKQNKQKPKIKMVTQQNQMKQIDLSEYKSSSEFKHLENVKEWIDFVQKQQNQKEQCTI